MRTQAVETHMKSSARDKTFKLKQLDNKKVITVRYNLQRIVDHSVMV